MTFHEFESMEHALEFMRRKEMEALEGLHPAQQTITYGSYAMRPAPEVPCVIFGRVWTREEIAEGERESGAEPAELEYTMKTLDESHNRGYRFGRWHSIVVPEGELGDAHIANLWPISKEVYEQAESNEWEIDRDAYIECLRTLGFF